MYTIQQEGLCALLQRYSLCPALHIQLLSSQFIPTTSIKMQLPHLFSHWSRSDIPDMHGRVAVVTGGNSGIGFEVARQLLDRGAEVAIVGRNEQLCEWAVEDLKEEFPHSSVRHFVCNLEILGEVKALAANLLATYPKIHILVNNAGRFLDEDFTTTPEGIEHTMAINYFGHVYLTMLLLGRLVASKPARIINVSSPAEGAGTYDPEDLTGTQLGSTAARSGIAIYGRSKLLLLMWTFELQRRLKAAGIRGVDVFATHPGVVNTALFNKVSPEYPFGILTYLLGVVFHQTPLQGAQSTLYTATEPSLEHKGGRYYGPGYATNMWHSYERAPQNPRAYDKRAAAELWEATLQEVRRVVPDALPPGVPA